jgi:hypothetical protein
LPGRVPPASLEDDCVGAVALAGADVDEDELPPPSDTSDTGAVFNVGVDIGAGTMLAPAVVDAVGVGVDCDRV